MNKLKKVIIAFLTLVMLSNIALAADVHVWRVAGAGSVEAFKNGQANGVLTESESSDTFYYNMGDTFKFKANPGNGWVFDKFCADSSCTVKSENSEFQGTITQTTGNVYVYFKQGVQAPGDATVTINVVQGQGTVDAYKGTTFIKSAGNGEVLNYKIGDAYKFVAKPGSGYKFEGFCTDNTCSSPVKTSTISGTITIPSGSVYVKFVPSLPGFEIAFAVLGITAISIIRRRNK